MKRQEQLARIKSAGWECPYRPDDNPAGIAWIVWARRPGNGEGGYNYVSADGRTRQEALKALADRVCGRF